LLRWFGLQSGLQDESAIYRQSLLAPGLKGRQQETKDWYCDTARGARGLVSSSLSKMAAEPTGIESSVAKFLNASCEATNQQRKSSPSPKAACESADPSL